MPKSQWMNKRDKNNIRNPEGWNFVSKSTWLCVLSIINKIHSLKIDSGKLLIYHYQAVTTNFKAILILVWINFNHILIQLTKRVIAFGRLNYYFKLNSGLWRLSRNVKRVDVSLSWLGCSLNILNIAYVGFSKWTMFLELTELFLIL